MTKYRIVLAGCGSMSGVWISAVRDHFSDVAEIVGLVDIRLESALKRAGEFGMENVWTGVSLEEALGALKPDALFNCTIPEAHFSTCLAGLRAGCHVLVEKPLASSLDEARQLIAASAETGKTLAVIQNRRYAAPIQAVKRALAEGAVGRVHSVFADFFIAPRFGGFRETMGHPLLLDMAIHTFDQARFMTGLDAISAHCHEFNPAGSWYAQGAGAVATFQLNGGAIFNYRGSWCAQGLPTSWESAWRIIGEKGTLLWDGGDTITVEYITEPYPGRGFIQAVERRAIPITPLPPEKTGHAGNISEFLDAIRSGAAPQTVAADNIRSLAMVEAAIRSAGEERAVRME
jgi:predicted dehydrogenase